MVVVGDERQSREEERGDSGLKSVERKRVERKRVERTRVERKRVERKRRRGRKVYIYRRG